MGDKLTSSVNGWMWSNLAVQNTDAARSIDILLINNTDQTLIWDDSGLEHGKRRITAPDFIEPGKKGRWMLESSGIATGCEGWMHWKVGEDGPMLKVNYDNPYYGSNEYNCWVHPKEDTRYEVSKSGGDGNTARIVFTAKNR
ncbi:hypothetical protein B0H66DRAFT_570082 [Apodospora peruviana]|uniref:Uncharacterized protein n=1 Tax=Apodospora peruviana TaxID=516989 RepID=A0AAE0LY77_9PEZI|nr:hypothetical protein B0H66DRAFT_570082 [Apodospora peruviana]